jgi:LuxR family maltose regulon positive regulatory protein
LFDRLARAGQVTIVSGPAGSGKTVLVGSWISESGRDERAAYVYARRDDHPRRFWLSVLDAVRGTTPGSAVPRGGKVAPDVDASTILEQLVDDLDSLAEPVWVVIDDLHELVSSEAHQQLELLLRQAPQALRLVLISRRESTLRLHRLRLRGDLTEIRTRDLRFTPEEALELVQGAGVTMPDSAVADLLKRTEGWAAGMRLALRSLLDHPDPCGFVAEFSGSERTVAEYLIAEVLERQPEHVRRLLLRTAMLERVSGPLADALTGDSGGERILQELERDNAFVVSLDAGRSLFRYHRMFADLLQLELRRAAPGEVHALHAAAAEWLAEHHYPVEATRHAQAAGNWSLAAGLLSEQWFGLTLSGNARIAHELVASFPSRARADDPALRLSRAADELIYGSLEEAKRHVVSAMQEWASLPPERSRRCRIMLEVLRLSLARQSGDLPAVVEEAERLIVTADSADAAQLGLSRELRAVATIGLGAGELWAARAEEADRHLEQGVALTRRIGRPFLEATALANWAALASLRSLRVATERSELATELARRHGWGQEPAAALANLVLTLTRVWQGRLSEAEPSLAQSERALRVVAEPPAGALLHAARGWLELARNRNEEALHAFRAAERVADRLVTPHVFRPGTRSLLLQTLVRLGETTRAEQALAEMGEEEREVGEIRIARAALQISQHDPQGAVASLAPVLKGATTMLGPQLWMVDAFLVDAIARDLLGDANAAARSVERALDLAEADRVLLPFLLHPTASLLARHSRHRTKHASLVADVIDLQAGRQPAFQLAESRPPLEPLSASETRVLRYLPTHLSLREVGSELYLSVNTIKAHIRSIYAKLDVHSRSEAIERARAGGLLAPSSR